MEISYSFIDEIYRAKSNARRFNNKQTPCFVRGFVRKNILSRLEYTKSCIQLPAFVLPAGLILKIVDVAQTDDIPGADL